MNLPLIIAVSAIITAAILYTVVIFSEYRSRTLRGWHVAVSWVAWVLDVSSTTLMAGLRDGFKFNAHGLPGVIAVTLMFILSLIGTYVLRSGREDLKEKFHYLSIAVWVLWMASFVTGIVLGIPAMHGL